MTNSFLQQLYRMSGGEMSADVSMYLIGEQLGLDKGEAAALAEDVIIDGFAELKTLAGGVSLTAKGLEALGKGGDSTAGGEDPSAYVLGTNEILDEADSRAVAAIIDEIRKVAADAVDYEDLEELVIDIKTVEVQLLSSRPKTAVVKAVLASLGNLMGRIGKSTLAAKIHTLTGEQEKSEPDQ